MKTVLDRFFVSHWARNQEPHCARSDDKYAEEAEVLLGEGADVVAPWRSAIPNPDRPKRVSNPAWEPTRPPFTIEELRARGLGKRLAENMGRKKGFVL